MSGNWYYARDGRRFGPFTFEQFKHLADSGLLLPIDMVWNDGTQQWVSAGMVEGLCTSAARPPEPAISRTLPPQEVQVHQPVHVDVQSQQDMGHGQRRQLSQDHSSSRGAGNKMVVAVVVIVLLVLAAWKGLLLWKSHDSFYKGADAMKKHDYDAAIALLSEAIHQQPDMGELLSNLVDSQLLGGCLFHPINKPYPGDNL